jgi:hypothetical protein
VRPAPGLGNPAGRAFTTSDGRWQSGAIFAP